jgi:tetratricopeptide (TPR) repeat protein
MLDAPSGWTRGATPWEIAAMVSPRRPFVGRGREIEELASGFDDAAGGRGSLFLVVGGAGMGKTRLCDEAARVAEQRGLRPMWGRCWETGGAPAYWPWIQILRELLRPPEGATLQAALGREGHALAQLLPEMAGGAETTIDPDPAASRFSLFQSVVALLRMAGERTPLLLVLDDLHAADPSSLALLHFVARSSRGLRLLILGAYRDEDVRLSAELGPALTDIAREGAYLPLGALAHAEIAALVTAVAGAAATAELVDTIERASEGNPLFLGELLRFMLQRGELPRPRTEGLPLPDSVKDVISRHVARLAPDTRAVLEAASIVGRDFAAMLVSTMAGLPRQGVEQCLLDAERAGLVVRTEGGARFAHVLVREALYRGIEPRRRAEAHLGLAEELERSAPGALTEIAHHRLTALPVGEPGQAATAARQAADRAMAMLAFEDAALLLEQALACGAAHEARDRCEVELLAGLAHLRAGAAPRGRAACVSAAAEARRLGDGALMARAALAYGAELHLAQTDGTLVELLEEALSALPPGPSGLRAQCLARLAAARQPSATPEPAMVMAREAVAMARAVGGDQMLVAVLSHAGSALADYAAPAERAALSEELVTRAGSLGDRVLMLRAHSRLVFDFFEMGRADRCLRAIEDYQSLARELRQPRHIWPGHLMRAMLALAAGRFDEADGLQDQAQKARPDDADLSTRFIFTCHALGRALVTERPDDFASAGRQVDACSADLPPEMREVWALCHAFLGARLGEQDATRERLRAINRDNSFLRSDLPLLALAAEPVALAADRALAALFHDRLARYTGRIGSFGRTGMVATGAVDTYLGIYALVLGRHDQAAQLFQAGLDRETAAGLRSAVPQTRLWYARLLLERRAAGDAGRAATLIAEARAAAERLGLAVLRERLAALERPGAASHPPPPAPTGVAFSLAREGEYWTVSAQGATCRLKGSRGLEMLAELVANPGREFHVLALTGTGGESADTGDAGALLDRRAIAEYGSRLEDLDEAIAEAESWSDTGRAARAREEKAALARELARGVGLGGRERRAGAAAERARTNVQRRIRGAIGKIAGSLPALGAYLERAVRTGIFCSYEPC